MSIAATQAQSTLGNIVNYLWNTGTNLLAKAQEEGPVQIGMNSEVRSLIGIYAMAQFPGTAVTGATLANIAPGRVKQATDMLEGALTGLWKRLSFNQKAGLAVVGVAAATYFDPTMVFTTLGTAIAFKLGAEYGLRNRVKEVRIAAELNATKNLQDPDAMN